jgi:release factor glutamine methyltransferase
VLVSDIFEGFKRDVRFDEVRGAGEFLQESYLIYGDEKTGPRNKKIRNPHVSLFDFILTNPPYIDAEAHTVDDSVAEHEPHLALFGGVAGMEIIIRIIAESPRYLTSTGQLWIEHEPAQVAAIEKLADKNGFTIITHPDQYGVPRFSVLTMAQ